jgi:HlyD family secretion protein
MLMLMLVACLSGDGDLETAVAVRQDMEVLLQFKGELEAKVSTDLLMPLIEGRPDIAWIIDDGTHVEAGDLLVRFDTEELEKSLEEAKADLDVALAQISRHSARLALSAGNARQAVVVAELDQELAEMRQTESETVPFVERVEGNTDATKAKMATDAARTGLTRVELDAQTDLQLLELTAAKRRRQVAYAEKQIALASMTAPAPGLVVVGTTWQEEKFEVGNTVWPGQIVMSLPDLKEMQVVAWVHEVDSPNLRLEQAGQVTLDAHPQAPSTGKLAEIGALALEHGEHRIKHVAVTLSIDHTTSDMKPGMTVEVDLLVQDLKEVVQVPSVAVRYQDGQPTVWVKAWSGWQPTPVDVLGKHGPLVAIEGVDSGATVALSDPTS